MGDVEIWGWKLEEVHKFKYLVMLLEGKGGTGKEIKNKVVEEMIVLGD